MGFSARIVAVEADWPDAEAVDRYVRRRPGPGPQASVESDGVAKRAGREPAFLRFPTWMWRNQEVKEFVEWLREWNRGIIDVHDAVAGFYGFQTYTHLGASMRAVIEYLDHIDKGMASAARNRYARLMQWAEGAAGILGSELSSHQDSRGARTKVLAMLKDLLRKRCEYSSARWNGVEFHGSEQNTRTLSRSARADAGEGAHYLGLYPHQRRLTNEMGTDAEHYFRAMYYGHDR